LDHPNLSGEGLKNYIVRSKYKNDLGMISAAAVGALGEPES